MIKFNRFGRRFATRTSSLTMPLRDAEHLISSTPHPKWRAIFLLIYRCGLKRIDICRLNLVDFDVKRKTLTVGSRVIVVDGRVYDSIYRYLLTDSPRTDQYPLFISDAFRNRGRRLTPIGILDRFKYYCKVAGLDPIYTPQSLKSSLREAIREMRKSLPRKPSSSCISMVKRYIDAKKRNNEKIILM